MVQNITLTMWRATYSIFPTVNEDVNNLMFTNIPIKFKLLVMSKPEWESYLRGEEYQHDVIRECITQFEVMIFVKDHTGSNAYIHVRRQIRDLKVNLHVGIRKYEERPTDFQKCLPFYLWVSDEKLGKQKLQYDKEELSKILYTTILESQ